MAYQLPVNVIISPTTCIDVIDNITKTIDNVNTELILNMIDTQVHYEDVCIKPNITFEHYYNSLKKQWEQILNNYLNTPNKCFGNMQSLLFLREIGSKLQNGESYSLDELNKINTDKIEKKFMIKYTMLLLI